MGEMDKEEWRERERKMLNTIECQIKKENIAGRMEEKEKRKIR